MIAQKLPEDKQKEIFTRSRIDGLVFSLLHGGEETEAKRDFNSRRAELAAILVEKGTNLNSYQYELLNKDTPSLVEPTINHLRQAVNICKDISRKLELMRIVKEAEKEEMVYLFSWQLMFYTEKHRLEEFILNETGEYVIDIQNPTKWSLEKLESTFIVEAGFETRTFSITMNGTKTEAEVLISDIDHNIIYNKQLLVKPAENSGNDFNIYKKTKKEKKRASTNSGLKYY